MTSKIGGVYVELKADVDAAGVVKGEQKIVNSAKKIQSEFKKTDTTISSSSKKIVEANNKASKSTTKFGRSAGMAGIQFQQFTGQIQGGVNPMIAFSQQAADLGIVMGAPLLGVVASLGAGLALFLVPELFNAKKATSELTDKLKDLKEEQVLTAEQTKFLEISQAAETKEKKKKITEIDKEIEKLTKLLELQESQKKSTGGGRSGEGNRKSANKRIEETTKLLSKNRAELDTLKQETGQLGIVSTDVEKARQEGLKKTNDVTVALQQQVALTSVGINEGEDAARRLAIALELGYTKAAMLPQAMKDSLTELEALEAKQIELNKTERAEAQTTAKLKSELLAKEGKAKTERTSNLDKIRAETATEQELLAAKYITQLELLEQSLINGEVLRDEYDSLRVGKAQILADNLLSIDKKKADAEEKLAEAAKQAKTTALSSTFGALSSLMNTGSRKLFKIGKMAALSGAIVDGIAAVQGAFKVGSSAGGPVLGAAYAAATAIKSAVQVQQIASQKFGGAGGGANTFSSGLPSVRTADSAQAPQTQQVDVRVTAAGGGIVDMFNFEVANGASPIGG